MKNIEEKIKVLTTVQKLEELIDELMPIIYEIEKGKFREMVEEETVEEYNANKEEYIKNSWGVYNITSVREYIDRLVDII